jgi:micrococcal nuclease
VLPRLVILVSVLLALLPVSSSAQSDDCADYDAWEWAQSIYDQQPSTRDGLDPDGNGIACDDLPRGGFAPAWWTDAIPGTAIEAELVSIVDGDTLVVTIDGAEDEVRFYRSDAPEYAGCGGVEATEFVQRALAFNDDDLKMFLESDVTGRDRYDRRLAYVWFQIEGKPYLLNEVLLRSGWARDVDYGDRLYGDQLGMAEQFAERWQIGQWELCGGFDASDLIGSDAPVEEITQEGPGAGECDPSYPGVCIPPIEVTGDLDCGQIEFRRFQVIQPDPHGFDAEGDGVGCESD